MAKATIIAIDGPAASGKSTLGRTLAEHLGYLYFDTGVMYRAVTLELLRKGLGVEGEQVCSQLAERIQIDVQPPSKEDGRLYDVLVDGEDATWAIREPRVDANVSVVSAYPGVRQALTGKQRQIGTREDVVMVGRDIGTVVLPEADLKIYLDASVEERARRRYEEGLARGEKLQAEKVLEAMRQRDEIDSTREIAPLRPADDAIVIDSDELDATQVFGRVMQLIEERGIRKSKKKEGGE